MDIINILKKVVHISHNGDFDALRAYGQIMVVGDVGLWLERILHTPNSTKGDSPKVAGTIDLLRVQGRWGASARLAYVRVILHSSTDVSGGDQLSKVAPNVFPLNSYWDAWGKFFDKIFSLHVNNVMKVQPCPESDRHFYRIDPAGEAQLIRIISKEIEANRQEGHEWTKAEIKAFANCAVRGFLRADLYNSLTEFLARAEGCLFLITKT